MNTDTPSLWFQLLALLAIEVGLIILLITGLQRWVTSPIWRRTLWQAALTSVIVLIAFELSGSGRLFAGWIRSRINPETIPAQTAQPISGFPKSSSDMGELQKVAINSGTLSTAEPNSSMAATIPSTFPNPSITPSPRGFSLEMWISLVWLFGSVLLLARIIIARYLAIMLRARRSSVADNDLIKRSQVLSAELGITRQIRLIESPTLKGPIAFGILQPTIALPFHFATQYDAPKRDAMLAHELAHLAAHDPFWYLLTDLATAFLWWHPAIWWGRRQLQAASESAADDASLLVSDGPKILAECLVEMGGRLVPTHAGLGVAGFRSHLGQRVERLLNLRSTKWTRPCRWHSAMAKSFGAAVMVTVVILCSAWAAPSELTKGDGMKTMRQSWKQTLSAIGLIAAVNSPDVTMAQNSPFQPLVAATTPATMPYEQQPITEETSKSRTALEAKLRAIVLDEVKYDALPLSEVLRHLSEESRKRDPEKKGINFLINPNNPTYVSQSALVDPATGLPLPATINEPVDVSEITIKFNLSLRNVSMQDLLKAIVKVADQPIQFSLEEYGVVFSLQGQYMKPVTFPSLLYVRTYRVDTNTIVASLKSTFGIKVNPEKNTVRNELQQYFREALGIAFQGEKLLIYNDVTGVFMVRANQQDHEVIAGVMETLGGQVNVANGSGAIGGAYGGSVPFR
jgi:beta-lactamase regulating signal transducer with metallopeptidase domain